MLKQSYKDKFHDFTSAAKGIEIYLETDRPFYAFKCLEKALKIGKEIMEKSKFEKTDKPIEWIDNLEA